MTDTFSGLTTLHSPLIKTNLYSNLKSWLEWSFLSLGEYSNEILSEEGSFGLDPSGTVLNNVSPTTYEGLGGSWVWQSGLTTPSGVDKPVICSGIYINGDFVGSGDTGIYEHTLDFNKGRVIFKNNVSGYEVKAEYSWPHINIQSADSESFRVVMEDLWSSYSDFDNKPNNNIPKNRRIYLPTIFIGIRNSSPTGFSLGGGKIFHHEIIMHVMADNPITRDQIVDALSYQSDRTIVLYNHGTAPQCFNFDGSLADGRLEYPQLKESYPWSRMRITDIKTVVPESQIGIYRGNVHFKTEVLMYGL
ncbi:MAG: hypothetical protein WC967_12705 [Balneolaceae bacterium]